MDTIENSSTAFHAQFDTNAKAILEPARDTLLESVASATREEIIGQVLMNYIGDSERLTADCKSRLVLVADHMGPDWCQALYHAAVFMTRVA